MRKVRCVKIDDYQESLLIGNVYDVLEESKYNIRICDEDGSTWWYSKEGFEDVILCITSGCDVGSLRTPLTPPLVPLGIILSPNFE